MLSCCCQAHRAEPGREWPCTRWCNGKHLLSAHFFQVLVELFINSRCAELTRHLEMHAAGKLLSHATLERLPFSCLRVGSLRAEGTNCVCPNQTYLRAGFEHVQPGLGHPAPRPLPATSQPLHVPAGISALALPAQALLLQFLPSNGLERGFIDEEWKSWQFRLASYMQAASRGQESNRHNGEEKLLLESF